MTSTAHARPHDHATLYRALFLCVPALIAAAVATAVLLASRDATLDVGPNTANQMEASPQ